MNPLWSNSPKLQPILWRMEVRRFVNTEPHASIRPLRLNSITRTGKQCEGSLYKHLHHRPAENPKKPLHLPERKTFGFGWGVIKLQREVCLEHEDSLCILDVLQNGKQLVTGFPPRSSLYWYYKPNYESRREEKLCRRTQIHQGNKFCIVVAFHKDTEIWYNATQSHCAFFIVVYNRLWQSPQGNTWVVLYDISMACHNEKYKRWIERNFSMCVKIYNP